jgi:subtilisin family serine protease
MKKVLVLVSLFTLFLANAAFGRQYILRAPAHAVANIAASNGLGVVRGLGDPGQNLFLVSGPDNDSPDHVVPAVRATSGVVAFEVDTRVTLPEVGAALNQSTVAILDALATQTSTQFAGQSWWDRYLDQPAVRIVNLPSAQQIALGGGTVAVIDTGVDPAHPALQAALVMGYDFTRNQAGLASELADLNPLIAAALAQSSASLTGKTAASVNQSTVAILDQSTVAILDGQLPAAFGHGTMVAGLIRRAAPAAKLMPLKAFEGDGTARISDILRAIYFAVNSGAKVINMSFNLSSPSMELYQALAFANSRNVIAVASTGNAGLQTVVYPAGWTSYVQGVASTTDTDTRSVFSNFGDAMVAVAAPGESLITTYPGNSYAAVSGTSFSAALVSGTSALLVGLNGQITPGQAAIALSEATALPGQGLGAGRIDAYRATGRVLNGF